MGTEDIQPGLIDLEVLDAPDAESEDVSFERLYSFLTTNEDIIITIDADQEEAVRRGLSVVKHNQQKRLRKAGEKADERIIKFNVVQKIPDTDPPQIKLQIWLEVRKGVFIHRLVVPEKGL